MEGAYRRLKMKTCLSGLEKFTTVQLLHILIFLHHNNSDKAPLHDRMVQLYIETIFHYTYIYIYIYIYYMQPNIMRETHAFQHNGDPVEGTPKTPQTSRYYCVEGLKGRTHWAPIIPRDTSLSTSQ